MAKFCINCEFMDKRPAEVGRGQMAMVPMCSNISCAEPVEGNPLPCQVARSNEAFCGMAGKHFAKKKEVPKEEGGNIVML